MVEDIAKNRESKPVELRSEKMRNIIGQIPSFLIRCGIGVIAVVVVLVLAVCYFIPYYETVEGKIIIVSNPASEIYISPVEGIFNASQNYWQDNQNTFQGDTVGYIKLQFANLISSSETSLKDSNYYICASMPADSVVWLIAGMSGKLLVNIAKGERIAKGDQLFAIIPDSIAVVYGRIILPYQLKEKIKEGQEVKIETEGLSSRSYGVLNGIISKIYPLPSDKGQDSVLLKADVTLPYGLVTTYQKELSFTPDMQGKGKITLSKQSLFMKLFCR